MSDDGFLKRWSRRKRSGAPAGESEAGDGQTAAPPRTERAIEPSPSARSVGANERLPDRGAPAVSAEKDEAIDPASLPPLDSLGPDSDYTMFLKKGVPEPLRIAALRKAWMSDPFIRDFRGPAEYALDYTTPEFDLRPTDDVAKMLDHVFPPKPVPSVAMPPAEIAPRLPGPQPDQAAPPSSLNLPQKEAVPSSLPASTDAPKSAVLEPPSPRRKHGGALPD